MTQQTTQERIYLMIHEMNGWTSPDERRLAQTIAAEIDELGEQLQAAQTEIERLRKIMQVA